MNIFHIFLFHIYTGIAFGALIHARGQQLTPLCYPDADETTKAAREEERKRAFDAVVIASQNLGSSMAQSVTASWMGEYNQHIVSTYEQSRQKQAVLESVDVAGSKGS